jgi:histidine triad (HIT) family protein
MSKDPSCIFCKIAAGDIPCLKIAEGNGYLAFVDIGPLADGHLLVIPKDHYARLEDMPVDAVTAVTRELPRLGRAVIQAMSAPAYNVLQNNGRESGQAVGHVHFHIIPRCAGDGLGYRWNASEYPEGRAEEVHDAILKALD